MMHTKYTPTIALLVLGFATLVAFQNCSQVDFASVSEAVKDPNGQDLGGPLTDTPPTDTPPTDLPPVSVCNGISCDLTPITRKPAVITALLAIGDHADDQLVVGGGSAQLVAETLVRYTSPVDDPKILAVLDSGSNGEDPEDAKYITETLLKRYRVTVLTESKNGLKDSDLAGYDLVWFNNPGHPMGSVNSRDALLRFKGGVVLQGDDLTRGDGFALDELTGLKYKSNGTEFTCNGVKYGADNNGGKQYSVTIDPKKVPGVNSSSMTFFYGNDIDDSEIVRPGLEVLAWAKGGVDGCTAERPTIVRYEK